MHIWLNFPKGLPSVSLERLVLASCLIRHTCCDTDEHICCRCLYSVLILYYTISISMDQIRVRYKIDLQ